MGEYKQKPTLILSLSIKNVVPLDIFDTFETKCGLKIQKRKKSPISMVLL
jgi:hypothetical protein